MAISRLSFLFSAYVNNNCSISEGNELMELINQPENEEEIRKLIDELMNEKGTDIGMPHFIAASILQRILQKDKEQISGTIHSRKVVTIPWMRFAAAAVVVFFISATVYWFFSNNNVGEDKLALNNTKQETVLPGTQGAILTMGDGRTIVLDSLQNGIIQKGNTHINKQGGLLIYDGASASGSSEGVVYNTLTTPPGKQYELVLADGSKVWLNAASSIRFPTYFAGSQREVELSGEAYFEVQKNKRKPFRVKVGDMSVNVLGTHFNVNAYSDEGSVKTSLLEGSVKIIKDKESEILKPGNQAVLNKKLNRISITDFDTNEVMAWKNGLFQFEGSDLKTIMRQIGRWYDVEIVYSGTVPVRTFEGKISRSAHLSDVLRILELSNVNFLVEGRKIIVQ